MIVVDIGVSAEDDSSADLIQVLCRHKIQSVPFGSFLYQSPKLGKTSSAFIPGLEQVRMSCYMWPATKKAILRVPCQCRNPSAHLACKLLSRSSRYTLQTGCCKLSIVMLRCAGWSDWYLLCEDEAPSIPLIPWVIPTYLRHLQVSH